MQTYISYYHSIAQIFSEFPQLIEGYNAFLPAGWAFDCSSDAVALVSPWSRCSPRRLSDLKPKQDLERQALQDELAQGDAFEPGQAYYVVTLHVPGLWCQDEEGFRR